MLVNGITNDYLLSIEGFCSILDEWNYGARQLEVTCKVNDDAYEKHLAWGYCRQRVLFCTAKRNC